MVDTIGFNDKTFVDNYRTPHTDQIHVVERFKMIEGGKTLWYYCVINSYVRLARLRHRSMGSAAGV